MKLYVINFHGNHERFQIDSICVYKLVLENINFFIFTIFDYGVIVVVRKSECLLPHLFYFYLFVIFYPGQPRQCLMKLL